MKKIAISCHYDSFENKYKHYGPSILVRDYFTYPILESGGVPIILPNIPYTDLILEKALEGIDGVIIYGGFDIDPIHYGEELTKPVHRYELRDENELALTQYCIKNNIPVFGTCRGMQLINVALGGSLHQDISLANATLIHEMNRDDHSKLAHRVDITNDSLIYKAIWNTNFLVNSFHHQSINRIWNNLKIGARSSDGIIEAIEHETLKLAWVQRHPEFNYHCNTESKKLFTYIVSDFFWL